MIQVSKDDFFEIIKRNELGVCIRVIEPYPFTDEFKFRDGAIFGRVEPISKNRDYSKFNDGYGRRYLIAERYVTAKTITPDGKVINSNN